ncbi:MAG: hypothetical protein EOO41_03690 [Methanobacteriota archaeon]|nr:MAG: hypothetical protein EOO41_03690 [Euryarchaeota archaeon]
MASSDRRCQHTPAERVSACCCGCLAATLHDGVDRYRHCSRSLGSRHCAIDACQARQDWQAQAPGRDRLHSPAPRDIAVVDITIDHQLMPGQGSGLMTLLELAWHDVFPGSGSAC